MMFIEAKGTYRQIGQKIGQQAKTLINRSLANYERYFLKIVETNFKNGLRLAQKYWMPTKKFIPRSFLMMQGIAVGAQVNFKYVFLINALEEVESEVGRSLKKCTSFVAKSPLGTFLAHNEDWCKFDALNSYVTKIIYPSGLISIGPTYGGQLPVKGLNSAGLAICDDSVSAIDDGVGIPRVCLMREALEARSVNEALRIVDHDQRAGGYHYYIAKGEQIISCETTRTKKICLPSIKHGDKAYALHNNCYLEPSLRTMDTTEEEIIQQELLSQKRGMLILKKTKKFTLPNLQAVLKNHPNVCTHNKAPYDSETINSFIADVKRKEIWIGQGRACKTAYQKYTF